VVASRKQNETKENPPLSKFLTVGMCHSVLWAWTSARVCFSLVEGPPAAQPGRAGTGGHLEDI
jgi:hypothetical protein